MSPPERADSASANPWLPRALGFVAVWAPFGVALSRAASSAQWRDDMAAVRDVGLVATGFGGFVSTLLTQALALLPLGSRTFRASLGGAIALAVASHFLYGLARDLLASAGATRGSGARTTTRLGAALAAIATLTAALSPTWQREATVGGGAMIATALVLAVCMSALRSLDDGLVLAPRAAIALSACSGAALAESPPAGLAIVAIVAAFLAGRLLVDRGARASGPPTRVVVAAAVACALTAALLSLPLVLRPLADRPSVDLGHTLSATDLSGLDRASVRATALSAWMREIGIVSLAIAGFGAATGLLAKRLRPLVAPLVVVVALDTLFPARAPSSLAADPLTSLRALALAALALASALGVYQVVHRVVVARFPLARATAVLVVVFHLTLVALTSEEAGFATDRSEQLAAECWTDEALGALPPRAAVLVRSPALAWRLWAARITRGERPDAMVIPVPLLDRGNVASSLATTDRAVEPLLRDFALVAEPSEFALSRVADVRPLHVELDPTWPKRLVSHLKLDGLWLEFAPEPLGPSDRRQSSAAAVTPIRRVLSTMTAATAPEPTTAAILAMTLRADANVLGALGDRDAADAVLARLTELSSREPSVETLRLPYALKGMRRALRRGEPARARP